MRIITPFLTFRILRAPFMRCLFKYIQQCLHVVNYSYVSKSKGFHEKRILHWERRKYCSATISPQFVPINQLYISHPSIQTAESRVYLRLLIASRAHFSWSKFKCVPALKGRDGVLCILPSGSIIFVPWTGVLSTAPHPAAFPQSGFALITFGITLSPLLSTQLNWWLFLVSDSNKNII